MSQSPFFVIQPMVCGIVDAAICVWHTVNTYENKLNIFFGNSYTFDSEFFDEVFRKCFLGTTCIAIYVTILNVAAVWKGLSWCFYIIRFDIFHFFHVMFFMSKKLYFNKVYTHKYEQLNTLETGNTLLCYWSYEPIKDCEETFLQNFL